MLCRQIVQFAFLSLLTPFAFAKRMPPKPVPPVVSKGVRYSANGDGRDEYVCAADVSTGSVLWKKKLFHNHIKFWIEEDVQWIYISRLELVGESLYVMDEKPRCFSLDLAGRHIKRLKCATLQP